MKKTNFSSEPFIFIGYPSLVMFCLLHDYIKALLPPKIWNAKLAFLIPFINYKLMNLGLLLPSVLMCG